MAEIFFIMKYFLSVAVWVIVLTRCSPTPGDITAPMACTNTTLIIIWISGKTTLEVNLNYLHLFWHFQYLLKAYLDSGMICVFINYQSSTHHHKIPLVWPLTQICSSNGQKVRAWPSLAHYMCTDTDMWCSSVQPHDRPGSHLNSAPQNTPSLTSHSNL